MKLKKKIAAMGAAVMIMASMSAIGASAYQASYGIVIELYLHIRLILQARQIQWER